MPVRNSDHPPLSCLCTNRCLEKNKMRTLFKFTLLNWWTTVFIQFFDIYAASAICYHDPSFDLNIIKYVLQNKQSYSKYDPQM